MAKLYIFGIGGTGSRVIKALTMLLASGVKIENTTEIVPIIIDPDRANGDLVRTMEILKKYIEIRKKIDSKEDNFFKTKITKLQEIGNIDENKKFSNEYGFNLLGVEGKSFKDFIAYNTLDKTNKSLVDLLFSEENLNAGMDVGFKGNPNIGSVVLNQFTDLEEFKHFASTFEKNDRIFIISSIFGGTGAAGFPLLLKNIREAGSKLDNHAFLKDAKIGAITILPYFNIKPDKESKINRATFYSKTKAALKYYKNNVSGNKSVNVLYYLGDNMSGQYENNEGAEDQKNNAHFIEMVAALSIIDFMSNEDKDLKVENAKAVEPKYKEYGITRNEEILNFTNLGGKTQKLIETPLTQYMLFMYYLKQHKDYAVSKDRQWTKTGEKKLNEAFFSKSFYQEDLTIFNTYFSTWLTEMANNKRAFKPFVFAVDKDNIFKIVEGIEEKTSFFSYNNYTLFDDRLSSIIKNLGDIPIEKKFITTFFNATQQLVEEKINF